MVKKRFLVALLLTVSVAAWQQIPVAIEKAPTSTVDPCSSTAWMGTMPPAALLVCPQGDGQTLLEAGAWFDLEIKDPLGAPIPGIPASDFWLVDCEAGMALCGGSGSCDADSATNDWGITTMRDAKVAAGGCAEWVNIVVDGWQLLAPFDCGYPLCFEVYVRSPDFNADLAVDTLDYTTLLNGYPPQPYSDCVDLDDDGEVALRDLAYFALHYGHSCD